jgi:hypothetical protein
MEELTFIVQRCYGPGLGQLFKSLKKPWDRRIIVFIFIEEKLEAQRG